LEAKLNTVLVAATLADTLVRVAVRFEVIDGGVLSIVTLNEDVELGFPAQSESVKFAA
jgi:hypothetical protein